MSESRSYARPGIPFVVLLLAGAIIAAFLITGQYDDARLNQIAYQYGIIPVRFEAAAGGVDWTQAAPALITHVFVHGGWAHLFMNMFALMQAAPFLALRMGGARFLTLFFLSAIGGGAAFILLNGHSDSPMVGASGAICGVFGAYFLAVRPTPHAALADPAVRNSILVFLGVNVVLMGFLAAAHILPIAWEAHLGGFVTGVLSYLALTPRRRAQGPWG